MAKKKNCVNCSLADFAQKKSGRRDLENGECGFTAEMSNAYMVGYGSLRNMPTKGSISKWTPENCSQWVSS